MAKGFVIHVGSYAPQTTVVAYPHPTTGAPVDGGFEKKQTVGSFQIINRARVWAKRTLPDGTLPLSADNKTEKPLEVTDPLYRGHLKFLPWGSREVGAQAIECRWLSNSNTLDYDYQKTIQKIETRVEDDTEHIYLTSGENKFDEDTQSLLVQMLKIHPQSRDSESKNPDPKIKGYTYYVLDEKSANKTAVRNMEAALDTGAFVKGLSTSPVALKNLLKVFLGYRVQFFIDADVNELSTETDIYQSLLVYSRERPSDFNSLVDRYKAEILDAFSFAQSHSAIDTSKNGFITFRPKQGSPVILYEKAEGKGTEMINWVVSNFLNEEIFTQIELLKSLNKKLE